MKKKIAKIKNSKNVSLISKSKLKFLKGGENVKGASRKPKID